MTYVFQSYSVGDVLTAAAMNQEEANARDHIHGVSGVTHVGVFPFGSFVAFTTQGSQAWTVPTNVTQIVAEVWGGGGAQGADVAGDRPPGGGGGYAQSILPVTPGETLVVLVGSGGVSANAHGGSSAILRSSTILITAGGGRADGSGLTIGSSGGIGSGQVSISGQPGGRLNASAGTGWGGQAARGGAGGYTYSIADTDAIWGDGQEPGGGAAGTRASIAHVGAKGRIVVWY